MAWLTERRTCITTDDAPDASATDLGVEHQLDADRADGCGIFETEVVANQVLGIVEERSLVVGPEVQVDVLGIGAQRAERRVEAREGGGHRALGRLEQEQPLQCRVYERALGGPRRRRLG